MNIRNRILLMTTGILLCAGAVALAQDKPDLESIAAGIKLNQDALRTYSWQSRVSVSIDGEQKKVDLFQVRYDSNDQLQKTAIGGEADTKKVRGPMRKQAAKKKKKEAAEFAEEIKDLLAKYTEPESMQKAIVNSFARTEDGLFKLQTNDVVVKGDSITIEVVEATKQPVSLKVETSVEEGPVVLNVMFQKLGDGTNYVAQSTIDSTFDKKKIEVVTENFSHVKQGG